MSVVRKYTMNLPTELVDTAVRDSGTSVTETVITALEEYRRKRAVELFLSLRGTMKLGASYEELTGKNDPDPWDQRR